jgi:hypothetical protein
VFAYLNSEESVEIVHRGFDDMTTAVADDEIDATLEQGLCHVHALPCATYGGTIPEGHDGDGEGDGEVQGETSTGAGAGAGRDDPPCMFHSHGATVTFEFSFAEMRLAVDRRLNPVERQQFLARSLSMVSRCPSGNSEVDGEEPESFMGRLRAFENHLQPLPSGAIPSAPSSVTIPPSTDAYHRQIGAWASESFPLLHLIAHLEDEGIPQGTTVPVLVNVKCRAIVMPSDDDDEQPRSLHAVLADVDEFEFEPVAESTYVLPGTVHLASDVVGVRDEDQGSQSSDEEASWPN